MKSGLRKKEVAFGANVYVSIVLIGIWSPDKILAGGNLEKKGGNGTP